MHPGVRLDKVFPCFLVVLWYLNVTLNISSQSHDPLVLLDLVCLEETLLEWLPVLEQVLGPAELGSAAAGDSSTEGLGEEKDYLTFSSEQEEESSCSSGESAEFTTLEKKEESLECGEKVDQCEKEPEDSNKGPPERVQVVLPKAVPSDLVADLTQLATLYTELSCFRKRMGDKALGCTIFLRRYFFLLDQERIRRMCLLCYQEQPQLQGSFIEGMLGQKSPCFYIFNYTYSRNYTHLVTLSNVHIHGIYIKAHGFNPVLVFSIFGKQLFIFVHRAHPVQ